MIIKLRLGWIMRMRWKSRIRIVVGLRVYRNRKLVVGVQATETS